MLGQESGFLTNPKISSPRWELVTGIGGQGNAGSCHECKQSGGPTSGSRQNQDPERDWNVGLWHV